MDGTSTHVWLLCMLPFLLWVFFWIVDAYYSDPVRVGSGRFHPLYYHIVDVVYHMEPRDVADVIFGISGWE